MAEPPRVLVVDDHEMFSEALALLFGREPGIELVASLPVGEDAVARCREEAPDVVLMVVDLPGIDGIEATRRIRAASPGHEGRGPDGHAEPFADHLRHGSGRLRLPVQDACGRRPDGGGAASGLG
jgi:CheY-like chemotaxis protein